MKRNTTLLWGAIFAVAVAASGCARAEAADVTVPSLIKKSIDQAREEASALGIRLDTSGLSGPCIEDAKCTIYQMEPKAGTVVPRGTEVTVAFLTNAEAAFYAKHRKMPKLVGLTEGKAQAILNPVDSVVDMDMKESRTVPKGTTRVLSQSPKAGKPLRIGQEITLVVGVNSSTSTSTGNPDTNIDLGDRGESRYCSKRRWC